MGQFIPSRSNIDGDLKFTASDAGIVHEGSGNVTQDTSFSNAVMVSATSGIITLVGASLSAGAEAEFQVMNSSVKSDSLVLLTVEVPATNAATATMVAQVTTIADNSFKVRLSNPGSGATGTNAHKIHFLVINKS